MKTASDQSHTNILALMLLVGVVQMALYYLAGATVRSDGAFGIAQPDTLLYCQAARRIVEGHPFSFSAGTAVSTGTTSVLYPFVLAIPYALGATGDAFFRAGFILNAAFYLVFLLGWGLTIRAKLADPFARIVAALLVALSGQAAYCAAAQSDIGLWMAVSALMIAGFATKRAILYAPMLLLAPWIRPEGMICALAYAACAIGAGFFHAGAERHREKSSLLISVAAIASVAGVFALNAALTGKLGFSSVANKGHFFHLPFCDAIAATAVDALSLAKSLLFGISSFATRDLYYLPVAAVALMWLGVCVRDWRRCETWRDAALLLAVLGSFGTVAMSGWQGSNMDRYLAWCLPIVLLLAAEGASWLARRIGTGPSRFVPAALVVGFGGLASVVCAAVFHAACVTQTSLVLFARQCDDTMTARSAVGIFGSCGLAYEFSPRRIAHLPGIYSPEFMARDQAAVFEILKNEKDTRFFYWFFNTTESSLLITAFGKDGLDLLGEVQLAGPRGFELRKASWKAFDAAVATPPTTNGQTLVARVDVGYELDERAAAYETITTYDQPELRPFAKAGKLGGVDIVEAGRIILGGDEMTVKLTPGRDAQVVMRTLAKAEAFAPGALGAVAGGECAFKSPMELHLEVDGKEVGHVTFKLNEEGFTDARFTIPGKAVTRSPCRVALHGDHIACCYWFYQ